MNCCVLCVLFFRAAAANHIIAITVTNTRTCPFACNASPDRRHLKRRRASSHRLEWAQQKKGTNDECTNKQKFLCFGRSRQPHRTQRHTGAKKPTPEPKKSPGLFASTKIASK